MILKKVVVTGLGAITPIGNNIKDYWTALIKGKNGVCPITSFEVKKLKTKFACQIKKYNPDNFFDKKEKKKLDFCSQYGIISSEEAIKESGINKFYKKKKDRIGVIWGTGLGNIFSFENEMFLTKKNNFKMSPFFIPKIIIDAIPSKISIKNKFYGPNYSIVSSCTSSSNAIINAYYLISLGKLDVVVTGGSEAPITKSIIRGFNALKVLSTRNYDYNHASRPFERDRDGFVLGEGSGCLILEEYKQAKYRGAKIYAEICGIGMSSDAYHITSPDPNVKGIIKAIKNALNHSGVSIKEIEYINSHGTSTKLGDIYEIKAIKKIFKKYIYNININSIKSMTGHLLGASGAIEAIASILSLKYGIIPPTINHSHRDKNISNKLNLTINQAQKKKIKISMSNNLGFGGHNTCLIFKKI